MCCEKQLKVLKTTLTLSKSEDLSWHKVSSLTKPYDLSHVCTEDKASYVNSGWNKSHWMHSLGNLKDI